MELETKHLSPYLPYGLKLQYIIRDKVERTGIMTSLSYYDSETHPARVSIDYYDREHIWMFKPMLKPMNKLSYDCIVELKLFIQEDKDFVISDPLSLQYESLQYLISRHYDVFGLIDKGLAVELID